MTLFDILIYLSCFIFTKLQMLSQNKEKWDSKNTLENPIKQTLVRIPDISFQSEDKIFNVLSQQKKIGIKKVQKNNDTITVMYKNGKVCKKFYISIAEILQEQQKMREQSKQSQEDIQSWVQLTKGTRYKSKKIGKPKPLSEKDKMKQKIKKAVDNLKKLIWNLNYVNKEQFKQFLETRILTTEKQSKNRYNRSKNGFSDLEEKIAQLSYDNEMETSLCAKLLDVGDARIFAIINGENHFNIYLCSTEYWEKIEKHCEDSNTKLKIDTIEDIFQKVWEDPWKVKNKDY